MSTGPIKDLGRSFDRVADAYDEGRPSYPDEVYRALTEVSGVELDGATTVDVGAGTGIMTCALRARGARVLAVDPGSRCWRGWCPRWRPSGARRWRPCWVTATRCRWPTGWPTW
ncbi:class I SAM-dependent methyltransferase [Nonomuraea antimicrobica]